MCQSDDHWKAILHLAVVPLSSTNLCFGSICHPHPISVSVCVFFLFCAVYFVQKTCISSFRSYSICAPSGWLTSKDPHQFSACSETIRWKRGFKGFGLSVRILKPNEGFSLEREIFTSYEWVSFRESGKLLPQQLSGKWGNCFSGTQLGPPFQLPLWLQSWTPPKSSAP